MASLKVALVFSQYGPYHHARATALREVLGEENFVAVQIASRSATYAWKTTGPDRHRLVTLCKGSEEEVSFVAVFLAAFKFWRREKIGAALLPSYSPASSLALLLSAKLAGVKCIMMNESHAGTEKARGLKRRIKKFLVSLFDAALVGGEPQKRHFVTLGMKPGRIFMGYDAIDNDFFVRKADHFRQSSGEDRRRLGLPSRYILSLGRMVEKKNLLLLIDAYAELRKRLGDKTPALVFVGSGDQEAILRDRCAGLDLKVIESPPGRGGGSQKIHDSQAAPDQCEGAVWMLGFRQIDENPAFYALADCFVLPSLWEEWGLVVNEAMACGLPVVVSRTVGSAEDLVQEGENGFQFDPNCVGELCNALEKLVVDPDLREKMGKASRRLIANWGCDRFAQGALAAITEARSA